MGEMIFFSFYALIAFVRIFYVSVSALSGVRVFQSNAVPNNFIAVQRSDWLDIAPKQLIRSMCTIFVQSRCTGGIL